jgi:hypothetical protein
VVRGGRVGGLGVGGWGGAQMLKCTLGPQEVHHVCLTAAGWCRSIDCHSFSVWDGVVCVQVQMRNECSTLQDACSCTAQLLLG